MHQYFHIPKDPNVARYESMIGVLEHAIDALGAVSAWVIDAYDR